MLYSHFVHIWKLGRAAVGVHDGSVSLEPNIKTFQLLNCTLRCVQCCLKCRVPDGPDTGRRDERLEFVGPGIGKC